jgi:medium-chain acyl-[acyl-carrier-protein] hydrolase
MDARWFRSSAARGVPRRRLFAHPHAGGGASAFTLIARALPDDVELWTFALPGREARVREPPIADREVLVGALAEIVTAHADLPYMLLGHSFGASIGFDLARRLRRAGVPPPLALFVSGRQAAHLPDRRPPVHHLEDARLVDELRRYGGTTAEVIENREMMALILPALRADLEMAETYVYTQEPPLDVPIFAYGGRDDEDVSAAELYAWRMHTRGRAQVRIFPGGHFYLYGSADAHAALAGDIAAVGRRGEA